MRDGCGPLAEGVRRRRITDERVALRKGGGMGYTISGTYVAACDCRLLCPCPVDGTPTGPNDQCHGAAAFGIAPVFRVGRTKGKFKGLGADVEASYGESAEFEYSSEGAGQTVRA